MTDERDGLYDTETESEERAIIIDGVVRRATGYWTPAVHALLRHLKTTAFARYAPEVLGVDDDGHEFLSYIPGDCGADAWQHVVPDDGLRAFARFVRAYHDAVAAFVPALDAVWALGVRRPAAGEIICHGDFGPWNVVWQSGRPIGLIDWDDAGPAPPMTDIAYALEHAVPFRNDEECVRWRRYPSPPDRRRRIETFGEAYGLSSAHGLVDGVIRAQRADMERVQLLADRGVERPARWVERGYLRELQDRIDWSERNRHLFE